MEVIITKKSELLNTFVSLKCSGCEGFRKVSLWDYFRGRKHQCACKDGHMGSFPDVVNDEDIPNER